jgi:hypothetical protein
VNLDQVTERRDWGRESLVEGADLAEWLAADHDEGGSTPIPKEALGVMLSPEIAPEEDAANRA